jgi:hypothetical protein
MLHRDNGRVMLSSYIHGRTGSGRAQGYDYQASMTRNFETVQSPRSGGLVRTAAHVAVARAGSALAILDLERGSMYATTPFGADAWAVLVEGRQLSDSMAGGRTGAASGDEGTEAAARIAGYLLDRRLIDPSNGGVDERK